MCASLVAGSANSCLTVSCLTIFVVVVTVFDGL